jgi:hypothetical protein
VNTPAPPEEPNDTYNPLWIVAMGMAALFAAMALIVALGSTD